MQSKLFPEREGRHHLRGVLQVRPRLPLSPQEAEEDPCLWGPALGLRPWGQVEPPSRITAAALNPMDRPSASPNTRSPKSLTALPVAWGTVDAGAPPSVPASTPRRLYVGARLTLSLDGTRDCRLPVPDVTLVARRTSPCSASSTRAREVDVVRTDPLPFPDADNDAVLVPSLSPVAAPNNIKPCNSMCSPIVSSRGSKTAAPAAGELESMCAELGGGQVPHSLVPLACKRLTYVLTWV